MSKHLYNISSGRVLPGSVAV